MPTKHPRIPITKDSALTEALDSVAPLFPGKKPATLVHDLALEGAQTVLGDQQRRQAALDRLVKWSTNLDDAQRDVLERIDELAWGA